MVQTPQVFERDLIYQAYRKIMAREQSGNLIPVTDDAMVVETVTTCKVKMVMGSQNTCAISKSSGVVILIFS
nr:2-C-methyl-D-erythritol 4-phosphate cytidylyltransferase [Roseburia sp. 499]